MKSFDSVSDPTVALSKPRNVHIKDADELQQRNYEDALIRKMRDSIGSGNNGDPYPPFNPCTSTPCRVAVGVAAVGLSTWGVYKAVSTGIALSANIG